MSKGFSDLVGLLIAGAGVLFFVWIIRSAMRKEAPPSAEAKPISAAALAPATKPVAIPAEDWRVAASQREAEGNAKLVYLAKGPIIGAIVIGNLITGCIGALLWWLAH